VSGRKSASADSTFSAVADLLSGANALPAENSAAFADALKTQIIPALGTPESVTARGQDFESVIKNLTGGARPFRHQGMVDFYTGAFGSTLLGHAVIDGQSWTVHRYGGYGAEIIFVLDGAGGSGSARVPARPS